MRSTIKAWPSGKSYRALRTINRLDRYKNTPCGFPRRCIKFHSDAIINRQILAYFPLILKEQIVLLQACANVEERNLAIFFEGQKGITIQITNEWLSDTNRNSQ